MHAVSRGAAYYGAARSGRGVRIRGGIPRTYYVGIQSSMPAVPGMPAPMKALTVAPFGMEEGTQTEVPSADIGLIQSGVPRLTTTGMIGGWRVGLPMVDMMTMLVIFLLQQFSSTGEVLYMQKDIKLPDAAIDRALHQAADAVTRWPAGDLFGGEP